MNLDKHKSHIDLLNQTHEILRAAKTDEYGRLRPSSEIGYYDFSITRTSLNRAINLFKQLLTELEQRGYRTTIVNNPQPYAYSKPWITRVMVLGYEVDIRLEEPTNRKKRELTKKEEKQSYLYGQYTYSPSGKLVLQIDDLSGNAAKKWSDTKSTLVEERIPLFIEALETTASAGKIRQIEFQKWKESVEQKRKVEELEAIRVQNLDILMRSWKSSQDIFRLAEHLERGMSDAVFPEEKQKSMQQWIGWMKQRSNALDPFEKIASINFE